MHFKIFLFVFFSFTILTLTGQTNNSFRAYINPIGVRVGNIDVQERGLEYYNIRTTRPYNYDAGILVSRKIGGNLHLNLGTGFKYDKLKIDYTIPDPFLENEIILVGDRYMRKYIFSPHLAVEFRKPKYYVGIGWEGNIDLDYQTNIIDQEGPIYNFSDPVNMKYAFLYFFEFENNLDDLSSNSSPIINLGYKVLPHWYININCRIKPYGKWLSYHLLIEGKTPDMPIANHILNNTRIVNRWIYASIGLAYDFKRKI